MILTKYAIYPTGAYTALTGKREREEKGREKEMEILIVTNREECRAVDNPQSRAFIPQVRINEVRTLHKK